MSYCKIGPDSDVTAYFDGDTYCVETISGRLRIFCEDLGAFKQALEMWKAQGATVPQVAFDRIAQEMAQEPLTAAKAEAATQGPET